MKIVVLNECFFDESHLDRLRKIGEVVEYKDTDSAEKAIERLKDADIAIADCFITPLNQRVFENSPKLKFISINSTGFDLVDIESASKHLIKVANVPNFATDAVAEMAIALMFAVNRKIVLVDRDMRKNFFEVDPGNENQRKYLGFNIKGKTLGIVGLGKIGQRVAEIGNGLGMKVIAYNRTPKDIENVELRTLEDVLKKSDVVSVNLALSSELENFISEKEIALMKPTAILINTARGKHVKTKALFNALKSGKIAGAGLDVLAESENSPLMELDNVVFTPHSGFFTKESLENMAEIIVGNVESYAKGEAKNIIS